jgi:uncharacterized phiE125 gp8 family phage protein
MISGDILALPAAATDQAKAYALVGRLVRSAADLCEQFTRQALLARTFRERVAAAGWYRLRRSPVRGVSSVDVLEGESTVPLAVNRYAVEIDSNGNGRLRLFRADPRQVVSISYEAGLATEWDGVPEALRQGIIRLAAHFYAHRDDRLADAPAAVTALWRPWRGLSLAS